MNLAEFRKDYGQNVSMTVCKMAYGYVLNENAPKASLSTAAIIYARKFMERPLKYSSYRVEQELGRVRIYQLQTETEYAQLALRRGNWDYNDRNLCIAALSENYRQKLIRSMEFPDELIVSVYEHFGRYISVVALEGCQKPSQVKEFSDIAHVLAVNALGYYDRYMDATSVFEHQNIISDCFLKYLMSQNIEVEFGKYYNDLGFFPASRKGMRIERYIEDKQKKMGTTIGIAQINVFGYSGNI